jgi:hypothetical protein
MDESKFGYEYEDGQGITIIKKGNKSGVQKHGSHNQKTHGGKGGGGANYTNLNDFLLNEPTPSDAELKEITTSQKPEYGQQAVYDYVNTNGMFFNRALRADEEGTMNTYGAKIRELDETMSRTPNITKGITVYRGIQSGEDDMPPEFEDLQVGDVFSDAGFVSTSLDPATAATFGLAGNPIANQGTVFRIDVPANSEGIFPNSWLGVSDNSASGEWEFLLPRGSSFKVNSKEGKVWNLEVVNG